MGKASDAVRMTERQELHLARTFGIFKEMVGIADLEVATDVIGNMRLYQTSVEVFPGTFVDPTPVHPAMPFGTIWRRPQALLETMHFAIYAMNRAAHRKQVVTVVTATYNGDSDVDSAVDVYKGLLDDDKAIARCAKDLAREFGKEFTTEAIMAEWTFTVQSMEIR